MATTSIADKLAKLEKKIAKDINDVMLKYAEDRAMSEMLGTVPSAVTA